jgi:hypothetical protein
MSTAEPAESMLENCPIWSPGAAVGARPQASAAGPTIRTSRNPRGPAILRSLPYEGNKIAEDQIFVLGVDAAPQPCKLPLWAEVRGLEGRGHIWGRSDITVPC